MGIVLIVKIERKKQRITDQNLVTRFGQTVFTLTNCLWFDQKNESCVASEASHHCDPASLVDRRCQCHAPFSRSRSIPGMWMCRNEHYALLREVTNAVLINLRSYERTDWRCNGTVHSAVTLQRYESSDSEERSDQLLQYLLLICCNV